MRDTFDGQGLPAFIGKAFAASIASGQLGRGFIRLHCPGYKTDQVIAFSCKSSGLRPSRDGKWMTEEAEHLVDHVIPQVPIRQWVITFPHDLRYLLAWNPQVRTGVLSAFMRAVRAHYVREAALAGITDAQIGAVSIAQRFNSAIDLGSHWHVLFADGVWHGDNAAPQFWLAPPLGTLDVADVLWDAEIRIRRYLRKRGWLTRKDDPNVKQNPVLASFQQASMSDQKRRERLGPVLREKTIAPLPKPAGRNSLHFDGFLLHANTRLGAQDRVGLEKLCKYVCRPAISADRLEILENNQIRVILKTPWRDGTTSVRYDRPAFMQRIAAQVPLPCRPIPRYHGVFAPNASMREHVVRARTRPRVQASAGEALSQAKLDSKLKWSEALKRSFGIDILQCE